MTASSSPAAVFLDRDGVINEDTVGPSFITSPQQLRILPGAAKAIRRLNDAGVLVIVVTNQEAVARGLITEEDLSAIHETLRAMLDAQAGARLDAIYHCPYHPEGTVREFARESPLRKPNAGMLMLAAEQHGLALTRCFMVGDNISDIVAGARAKCRTVLVLSGTEPPNVSECIPQPTHVAAHLEDAVGWILAFVNRDPISDR